MKALRTKVFYMEQRYIECCYKYLLAIFQTRDWTELLDQVWPRDRADKFCSTKRPRLDHAREFEWLTINEHLKSKQTKTKI